MAGAGSGPNTTLSNALNIPVVADPASAPNGVGLCTLASTVDPTWYTRVAPDAVQPYQWVSLASVGLGKAVTSNSTANPTLLSWTPPTLNTDGSALTDLSGFKVYQGTSAANLIALATSLGPTASSYSIASLPPATYFWAITALSPGGESPRSAVVSKTIAVPRPTVPQAPQAPSVR